MPPEELKVKAGLRVSSDPQPPRRSVDLLQQHLIPAEKQDKMLQTDSSLLLKNVSDVREVFTINQWELVLE